MKKTRFIPILLAVVAVVAVVFTVQWAFGLIDVGIITATGVVIAAPTTQDIVDSEISRFNKEDISRKVVEMLPSRTPLDTILRNIRDANRIESQVHTFYAVSSKPMKDVMASAGNGTPDGLAQATADITYTYATGDGLLKYWIKPANASSWAADDTFLMRNVEVLATGIVGVVTGTTKLIDVAFYIEKVDDGAMLIWPLNGIKGTTGNAEKYVMPDFANDISIYRMGNAKNELSAQTKPFAMLPEPESNFCQYFMAQVEEGTFQKITAKEADWDFSDFERQNVYAMRAEMEMSFIYGVKARVQNATANDWRYTTGGITRSIANLLEYGTGGTNRGVTQTQYMNWMKQIFVGNNGSQERILFAGSTLLASLHTVEDVQKQVEAKNTKVKWGITFQEIVTNFGSLLVYHHPLLSLSGAEDEGILLDMEHISKKEFYPLTVTTLDLKTSGQKLADAKVLGESSCVITSFPDCHARIKPKA